MWQSFSHLSGFLHHFVLAKLATSSIKVKMVIGKYFVCFTLCFYVINILYPISNDLTKGSIKTCNTYTLSAPYPSPSTCLSYTIKYWMCRQISNNLTIAKIKTVNTYTLSATCPSPSPRLSYTIKSWICVITSWSFWPLKFNDKNNFSEINSYVVLYY